jgi:hypothetical protein
MHKLVALRKKLLNGRLNDVADVADKIEKRGAAMSPLK